jgi:uncharacterized membrane protein (DUF485 family)
MQNGSTAAVKAVEMSQNLSPAFPPLSGGSGVTFCIGLAFTLMIVAWVSSILVRNAKLNSVDRLRFDHPTAIQRRRDAYLYWALAISSGFYAVKWLSWGEVDPSTYARIGSFEYFVWPMVAFFVFLHVVHGGVTSIMRRWYGVKTGAIRIGRGIKLSEADMRALVPPSMLEEMMSDYKDPFKSPLVPYAIMALTATLAIAVSFMKWYVHP